VWEKLLLNFHDFPHAKWIKGIFELWRCKIHNQVKYLVLFYFTLKKSVHQIEKIYSLPGLSNEPFKNINRKDLRVYNFLQAKLAIFIFIFKVHAQLVVTWECENRTVLQRYNIGLLFCFRNLKWQLIINGL